METAGGEGTGAGVWQWQVLFFLGLLARMLLQGTAVPRIGLAVVTWWTFRCAAAAFVSFVNSFSNPATGPTYAAAAAAASAAAAATAASNAAGAVSPSHTSARRAGLWESAMQGAAKAAELGGSAAASAAEAMVITGWKVGKVAATFVAGPSPCAPVRGV